MLLVFQNTIPEIIFESNKLNSHRMEGNNFLIPMVTSVYFTCAVIQIREEHTNSYRDTV
jgi:hypothetical protein